MVCVPEQKKPVLKPAHPFIDWSQGVVGDDLHVFIDTETTDKYGEVIDLAILSSRGKELYNSLLKPKGRIAKDAQDIHHITHEMTDHAPSIINEWPKICDIVGNRIIITYNAKFDQARIEQTLRLHGLQKCASCQWRYECAMLKYAAFWNAPPRWDGAGPAWQQLSTACHQQGIMLPPGLHRAMPDCQATWALLCKVAATGVNSMTYGKMETSKQ